MVAKTSLKHDAGPNGQHGSSKSHSPFIESQTPAGQGVCQASFKVTFLGIGSFLLPTERGRGLFSSPHSLPPGNSPIGVLKSFAPCGH